MDATKLAKKLMTMPEIVILAGGAASGFVGVLVAVVGARFMVPVDFFAVAAQVFPVFIVALAVEQRLADRLGTTEEQYVRDANHALGLFVDAIQRYEEEDHEQALRLQNAGRGQRGSRWVEDVAYGIYEGDPDEQAGFETQARDRYRMRRKAEIILVAGVIVLLLMGELVAIVGLLSDGTGSRSLCFLLTLGALVASFIVITLAAFRDLMPAGRA